MRALTTVLLASILAACASPTTPTAKSNKAKTSESDPKKHASDDSSDDDDDSEQSSAATTTGDDDDGPATEESPNPVTGLSSLPGSKIFKPAKLPAPAIVMLHGSEGGSEGSIEGFAQEMSAEGFVVLTLCWFDCKGLSSTIERIPLETVVNAGRWLKGTKDVNGKVGLFGWSRGAEMSLLVGSKTNTDPYSVIAVHAPSDTVVAAFDPKSDTGDILENGKPAPAWTWKGKDLFGEPDTTFETPGPLIDVNAFKGPLYVSQGTADEVWPVTRGRHVVSMRKSDLVTKSRFFQGAKHVLTKQADIVAQRNDITTLFHAQLDGGK
ncbi:MAG: hypothetical protein U0270_32535 [Labilithrix sp.]